LRFPQQRGARLQWADSRRHLFRFAPPAAYEVLLLVPYEAGPFEGVGVQPLLPLSIGDDAKQFARDMIRDHGKAVALLGDAAKRDGIELPAALDAEHAAK
jgi:hypothetical protein